MTKAACLLGQSRIFRVISGIDRGLVRTDHHSTSWSSGKSLANKGKEAPLLLLLYLNDQKDRYI